MNTDNRPCDKDFAYILSRRHRDIFYEIKDGHILFYAYCSDRYLGYYVNYRRIILRLRKTGAIL